MQQLNHVVAVRAQQGCYVDQIEAGVEHRQRPATTSSADSEADGKEGENGNSRSGDHQVNLFFNVLLKRVVPVMPDGLIEGDGDDDGDDEADADQCDNQNQEEALAAAADNDEGD